MLAPTKVMAFLAVVGLACSPATAQHHHAMHHSMAGGLHPWHHLGHPWGGFIGVYEPMSLNGSYSYGYPVVSTPSYGSAAAALAALNWQQAQAREQELRAGEQELAKKYADMEQARRQGHADRREKRNADREQRARRRAESQKNAAGTGRRQAPEVLVRHGALAWPATLRGDDFQAGRESLERLFAEGPKDGDLGRGSEFALEVERHSMEILAELKTKTCRGEVRCGDYALAKRFVAGLVEASRHPGAVDQVASR